MFVKKTPIYDEHIKANGRIIDFAGWYLPVEYTRLIEEHNIVRSQVGLFDVSHMGEILISGKNAEDLVQYLITNDVSKLYKGKAIYSPMCYNDGGIIDDLLIYMLDDNKYLLVVNASNTKKDFEWINSVNSFGASVEDLSDFYFQLALQGPKSTETIKNIFGVDLSKLQSFHFKELKLNNIDLIVSKTGYTGEDGFEIYGESSNAKKLWQLFIEHGVKPCGLGCRDTLRLEAALPLYGNDLNKNINPLEAGLNHFVKLDKKDFCGKDILIKQKKDGLFKKLHGFTVEGKGIARHDYKIVDNNKNIAGIVTSGTLSPTLGYAIGMAYISKGFLEADLFVEIRKNLLPIKIAKMPFYKKQSSC